MDPGDGKSCDICWALQHSFAIQIYELWQKLDAKILVVTVCWSGPWSEPEPVTNLIDELDIPTTRASTKVIHIVELRLTRADASLDVKAGAVIPTAAKLGTDISDPAKAHGCTIQFVFSSSQSRLQKELRLKAL